MDAAHARISESRNWKREQRQASRLSCVIWPASSIETTEVRSEPQKLSAVRGGKPEGQELREALCPNCASSLPFPVNHSGSTSLFTNFCNNRRTRRRPACQRCRKPRRCHQRSSPNIQSCFTI